MIADDDRAAPAARLAAALFDAAPLDVAAAPAIAAVLAGPIPATASASR
ncbi:MAG: hypothetical protein H6709_07950 [Kofleriaceae bacterium]|nr:hypothetical protein [Kofleriaceae bacterium]